MVLIVPDADANTTILLVHAPYPGILKFPGTPSSLLFAFSPLAYSLGERFPSERIGLLDSVNGAATFWARFEQILDSASPRVVAISTSTAAIGETCKIVSQIRARCGSHVLVLVGGPHEDDCNEKAASRIDGIDISIGGDAEYVIEAILLKFLACSDAPAVFCSNLRQFLSSARISGGIVTLTSRWWSDPNSQTFSFGPIDITTLPPRVESSHAVRFSVFKAQQTLPVMISRGCAYGKCTFCAEGGGSGILVHANVDWLRDLYNSSPGAAFYFQDSIFPRTKLIETNLLPFLKDLGVEWGCQLYLKTASRPFIQLLAAHGCSYVYTGIESASPEILAAIGKRGNDNDSTIERLGWLRDAGIRVGVSLMFGNLSTDGILIESEKSIDTTVAMCHKIVASGVSITGFYPNVMTVLPGTGLARGLAQAGHELDYYDIPICDVFGKFEDGSVGFNFCTIPGIVDAKRRIQITEGIVRSASELLALNSPPDSGEK